MESICHSRESASRSSGGRPLGHLAPVDWIGGNLLLDPRHIFGEERQVLPEKCSAHIIVGNIKVATISAGALAPALSASVKTFGDDTVLLHEE